MSKAVIVLLVIGALVAAPVPTIAILLYLAVFAAITLFLERANRS